METFLKKQFKAMTRAVTHSPDETELFAAKFVRTLGEGAVAGLIGDLGAGKTCFVQGAAAALGADKEDVVSPTFNIVREYSAAGKTAVYHFDLYRITGNTELEQAGYRDYLQVPGVLVFIEWPGNVREVMDDLTHAVLIESKGKNTRQITVYERKKTQQKRAGKRQTKKGVKRPRR